MYKSILKMEKHEIFDLVEALYCYSTLHINGLGSDMHVLQSEIGGVFSPGCGYSESIVESDNFYYGEIDSDETAQNIWNRVKYVLDNRWDDMD